MVRRNYIILLLLVSLLFTTNILTGCWGGNMRSKESSLNFAELIEQVKLNDINLTIYFMNPSSFTRFPLSVDNLVYGITAGNEPPREKNDKNGLYDSKIVIDENKLKKHIDLLNRLSNTALIPVEKNSYLDARIYYIFKNKKGDKLFDAAMWGGENNSIFVNGVEVQANNILYDVIKPFLTEDDLNEYETYLNRWNLEETSG